jgi:hypothetical protein
MRSLVAFSTAFVLVACGSAPPARDQSQPQDASMSPVVEFLLTSAATDFHTQRPPRPVRFRNVRSGYVITSDGTRQYRLCGEYLPADEEGKAHWTPFVTIKTSPYEQWLGDQAVGFCKRDSMVWETGDLSSRLQSRLGSLR